MNQVIQVEDLVPGKKYKALIGPLSLDLGTFIKQIPNQDPEKIDLLFKSVNGTMYTHEHDPSSILMEAE